MRRIRESDDTPPEPVHSGPPPPTPTVVRWFNPVIPKKGCRGSCCVQETTNEEWIHEMEKRVKRIAMWTKLGVAALPIFVAVATFFATLR